MALTVEDGTGKATAESYGSVADATAYFAARGNTAWASLASDALREAALRQATEYLDAVYAGRWKGDRYTAAQALSWPRYNVLVDGYALDADTLPTALVRATFELALRASAGELLSDAGAQVKSETVGPISVTYADGARQGTRYALVESMLSALLRVGTGQIPMVRA